MRQFQVQDTTTAIKLVQWSFLNSRPRPLVHENTTRYGFNYQIHPIDTSKGALLDIPESGEDAGEAYIHPISKVITDVQGGSLSQDQKDLVRSYWKNEYKNFQDFDGTYPFQSSDDLVNFVSGVWATVQKFYPLQSELDDIISLMQNNSRVAVVDLLPSEIIESQGNQIPVIEKTEVEVFNEKWRPVDFNRLTETDLARARFPSIDSAIASDIVADRASSDFFDPADVANRVTSVGSTIESELDAQISEGSLTFSKI